MEQPQEENVYAVYDVEEAHIGEVYKSLEQCKEALELQVIYLFNEESEELDIKLRNLIVSGNKKSEAKKKPVKRVVKKPVKKTAKKGAKKDSSESESVICNLSVTESVPFTATNDFKEFDDTDHFEHLSLEEVNDEINQLKELKNNKYNILKKVRSNLKVVTFKVC